MDYLTLQGLSEGDIDDLEDNRMLLEDHLLVSAENNDENDIDEETMYVKTTYRLVILIQ